MSSSVALIRLKSSPSNSFIGACSRSPTLISIYFSMLVAHLGFSIFSGAFSLYAVFHGDGKVILDECVAQSAVDVAQAAAQGIALNAAKDCQKALAIFRGLAVGAFVVIWLFEICMSFVRCTDVGSSDGSQMAASSCTTIPPSLTRKTSSNSLRTEIQKLHRSTLVVLQPSMDHRLQLVCLVRYHFGLRLITCYFIRFF
jgi:hypothetical protein